MILQRRFRAEFGSYWIELPRSAAIVAKMHAPEPEAYQSASPRWVILLGRFRMSISLDPLQDLQELKGSIDDATKGDVVTPTITVNGVSGVTHGDYGPPRTWIDWWFKKGDLMIRLRLLSESFPFTFPSNEERAEHDAIVRSLKYCKDFATEPLPRP